MLDCQRRAHAKYEAEKVKSFRVKFFPKDGELWSHLQKQERKSEYIRELIRKDMEGGE